MNELAGALRAAGASSLAVDRLIGIRGALVALALGLASVCGGCGVWEIVPSPSGSAETKFEVPERRIESSSLALLKRFEDAGEPVYRLGAGDEIVLSVAGRSEISGQHLVGPDGIITVPYAGPIEIGGATRDEAAQRVLQALNPYYLDLSVTVGVMRYGSNRIVVIGRVENPGVLQFDTPPYLLDALAQAGGLPLLRPEQLLTRCAVIRGDNILWVDVGSLLKGNLALNIRLQRNDVIYIPDSTDTPVYVLGEVNSPGVYRLTPQMSFMDALSQAGGPSRNANLDRIHVIRPSDGGHLVFSLMEILKPDPRLNVAMKEGDIVYVARNGVSQIGYILENFNPLSTLLTINQLTATE